MTLKLPFYALEFENQMQALTELKKQGYIFDFEIKESGAEISRNPDYDVSLIDKSAKYNPDPEAEPKYNDGYLVNIQCPTEIPLTSEQKAKLPLLNPQPNPLYLKNKFAGVEPIIEV